MATSEHEEYMNSIHAIHAEDASVEEVVALYGKRSLQYEAELLSLGYCLHEIVVDCLLDVIEADTEITKSSSIIDFGAGTGLVGKYLRAKGFTGKIDAHDGSEEMLKMAKLKEGVYSATTYCHIIEPHTAMPRQLSSGLYDVAIACASLLPNRVSYDCLKHLINSVRVGGLIIFSARKATLESEMEYNLKLQREAFQFEKLGIWELTDMKFNRKYRRGRPELNQSENMSIFVYCYKKHKNL